MPDDAQLLREYTESRSETAFAQLVRRHLGWVYNTALRRTGGRRDLAQDITQYVFIVLAQKAGSLSQREILAGWLFTTTRYAASRLMRSESRRRIHELAAATAATMTLPDESPVDDWKDLRPSLDLVLDRLSKPERDALFLRFFEDKSFGEIGVILRLGEDGARRRVERALDRLNVHLNRRGITSTTAGVAGLLRAEGLSAAPAEVVAATTMSALASAAPAGSSFGLIYLMTATKTTLSVATLTGLAGIIALSITPIAFYEVRSAREKQAALAGAMSQYRSDQERLRQAEQEARAAADKLAALKAKTETARQVANAGSAAGTGTANSSVDQPHQDAEAFLAAYGQAKSMVAELAKVQIDRKNALFFRQAEITPAQIDAFESATLRQQRETLEINPSGTIYPTQGVLPDDQLQAILGNAGAQAYKDYLRATPAQNWAGALAGAAAQEGAPMSLDQVSALVQAVANNSPDYASGGSVKPVAVDWAAALAQAKQNLTDAQWESVQPVILARQFIIEANAAAQKGGK